MGVLGHVLDGDPGVGRLDLRQDCTARTVATTMSDLSHRSGKLTSVMSGRDRAHLGGEMSKRWFLVDDLVTVQGVRLIHYLCDH